MAEPRDTRSARVGVGVAVVVVAAAFVVPAVAGWQVYTRRDGSGLPPLHGYWQPGLGPGTLPAILLAVLALRYAGGLAERLAWRPLLATSYAAGLAWLLALAYVDGQRGIERVLGNSYEYLPTARAVHDVPATIASFVDRIPYAAAPDNWVTHVAGHPVGALLVFVGLDRVGLGGDAAAAYVVVAVAATTALAVLVTLRTLGAEPAARRAAPYLVLTPAAVFMAVSADALFAAVVAWGLAALALGATTHGPRGVAWSALAGLLLGVGVELSYGLVLMGVLALAVLVAARSWRPLPVAVVAALVPVLALAVMGFAWWEAYPVLVQRYQDGVAADRPASYWWWGNLGALLVATGPMLGAGLALVVRRPVGARVVVLLAGAAALTIAMADASGMSKGETERIWLPWVPWLTVSLALLPAPWRRWALGMQLLTALVVQHLLYTSW